MKTVHFVGIGGAGTSAAAALAKKSGFEVTGCDTDPDSIFFQELKKLGIKIEVGHDQSHLKNKDFLVVSNAIGKLSINNSEITKAKKVNLPILTTEKFVADCLGKGKFLIAIAGTHGKSTTTAMIGQILEDAGLDPTVYVGSIVTKWGKNYRFGKSKYFVVEADEYEDKFLDYHPNIGVVTNIEYDHPDYFKNERQVVGSFVNFVKNFATESRLILGTDPTDSENIKKLIEGTGDITTVVTCKEASLNGSNFELQITGHHNQLNAEAAYLCAGEVGVQDNLIKESLKRFSGISRRFESKSEVRGIKIFDDYAHHPTEISATLSAAREKFKNETIWCVFQPHTFSRTKALFEKFVKSFEEADIDKLVFVDIYAAREREDNEVSSLDLAKSVKNKKAIYIGDMEEAATYVAKNTTSGDIIIAMGAGDIYKFSNILVNKLKG